MQQQKVIALESDELIQWIIGANHGATEEMCDATTESD